MGVRRGRPAVPVELSGDERETPQVVAGFGVAVPDRARGGAGPREQ